MLCAGVGDVGFTFHARSEAQRLGFVEVEGGGQEREQGQEDVDVNLKEEEQEQVHPRMKIGVSSSVRHLPSSSKSAPPRFWNDSGS